MKRTTHVFVVAVLALGTVACGGGAKFAPGKENAAAALFGASGPTSDAPGAYNPSGFLTYSSPNIPCKLGGSTKMEFNLLDVAQNAAALSFLIKFQGCQHLYWDNPDTEAVEQEKVPMDGEMKTTMGFTSSDFKSDTYSGGAELKLKGRVNFGGPLGDFVDADITQTTSYTFLKAEQGVEVSVTLNGKITNSTGTYDFPNETVSIKAGLLVTQPKSGS